MTKTLYVKIESMIKLENMPSDYGASLTLDGYELGRGTFALPKYEEWQDTLTDWDYIQNTIVAVQDTMPADFNIAVSASGYITRLAWYEITVPNNYEPPPDLNGGGGENPPPEPPDPSTFAELYAGRWSDHWTDTDGLIHYYPQAGAFAELWQTSDEDALRGMLDAQMRILGTYDYYTFKMAADVLGFNSSSKIAAQTRSDRAAETLAKSVFAVADIVTASPPPAEDVSSWLKLGGQFWKAQTGLEKALTTELPAAYKGLTGDKLDINDVKMLAATATSQTLSIMHLENQDAFFVGYGTNELLPWLDDSMLVNKASLGFWYQAINQFNVGTEFSGETSDSGVFFGSIQNDVMDLTGISEAHVFTGLGNDSVFTGDNLGVVDTGDGNDYIEVHGVFKQVHGGKGVDTLKLWSGDQGVEIDVSLGTVIFRNDDPNPSVTGLISGVEKFIGTQVNDWMFGSKAVDNFQGSYGSDLLVGNGGNDFLYGDDGMDFLFGQDGNDYIVGGEDADDLNGGKGMDKFVFEQQAEFGDTIYDFTKGDKIALSENAIGYMQGTGKLLVQHFVAGTGNEALDSDDYVIFDTDTSTLWFDGDGLGGSDSVLIAIFDNKYLVGAADIVVV